MCLKRCENSLLLIKLMNLVMYITLIGLNKAFVKILILTVPIPSIVALIAAYGLMTGMDYQNIALNVGRRWKRIMSKSSVAVI